FFHDVTYEHRLRDHPDELYVFQELTYSPYSQVEDDEITLRSAQSEPQSPTLSLTTSGLALPTGVFTQLTDCYSPTCSTDQICYSATCPRRLEQRARMRMSANEGVAQALSASISEDRKEERLWSKTVPKHIVDSVTKKELKRQEMIFELVYTEKDYVRDLELLNEIYLKPLQHRDIIPEDKRHKFIFAIFFNLPTVLTVNLGFRDALNRRQGESYIVDQIGDIVKYHATKFTPYVRYGAHQVLARHFLDMERSRNPEFDRFLDEQERHPEARKLSVHSFLNRPTTRLGRYPLLLRGIRDATAEGHPDRENLDKAMDAIKTLLSQINVETGKASNRVRLSKLKDQLQCKPSDTNDLNLLEEGRQIVQEGPLKKRSSVETTEVTCFLLDHMFLMARKKKGKENGMQGYKIIKRPIPLELLTVTIPDEQSAETPTPNAANANSPGGVSGLKSGGLVGLARPLGRSNAMFSSTTHLPSPQLQRPGGDNLMSAKLG
ncbi:RHO1 GDP-GTP exchange protein 2, partial [Dimargaris verticillata]